MKAYELLDTPDKWTQCSLARDQRRTPVESLSKEAVCWCLVGALQVCYPVYAVRRAAYLQISERKKLAVADISWWNDQRVRTYEDVVALLKELDI